MNKIILIGNLTRDPELRTANTANGPTSVCSFDIAVNRRGRRQDGGNAQEQTDFFRITAWRQLGENCSRYLAKGRKVYVSGPLSARTYQASDGSTRVSLEVTADEVEFLSSRNDAGAAPAASAGYAPAAEPTVTAQKGFTDVESDDLPF